MQTKILKYNVIITKENKHYIAYVPTLDLSDFGKSVEEARKNVTQAIECHLEGLQKTGSEIPAHDVEFPYVSQTEVIFPHKIAPAF